MSTSMLMYGSQDPCPTISINTAVWYLIINISLALQQTFPHTLHIGKKPKCANYENDKFVFI